MTVDEMMEAIQSTRFSAECSIASGPSVFETAVKNQPAAIALWVEMGSNPVAVYQVFIRCMWLILSVHSYDNETEEYRYDTAVAVYLGLLRDKYGCMDLAGHAAAHVRPNQRWFWARHTAFDIRSRIGKGAIPA